MKDLGPAKKILWPKIERDRSNKLLKLTQKKYTEKILKRFCMEDAKTVRTPLVGYFKNISKQLNPKSDEEKSRMEKIP